MAKDPEPQTHFEKELQGFLNFIRDKGVIGLAVGIILGTSVTALVRSVVDGIINPLLGAMLPESDNLASASLTVNNTVFAVGTVISAFIDFMVIALVVYFGIKWLRLDKLEKPKDK